MEKSGIKHLEAERHGSAASLSLRSKYIEISDFRLSLRGSTGETIIGRKLDSTLNDQNARDLSPKKFSNLWVHPFWCKTTFCEPEKSDRNIHFQPNWSKLY